ncbi:MAG: ATP-binding protein [Campylobacter sp.]|nr:ATP-binding protein [Campylobacter sp.]
MAKVISVAQGDVGELAPTYYKQKGLKVESWFIISDLRELVRDDFAGIRDNFLANFTTPAYKNHTYAIYGNAYVYPLIVDMKQEINYFESELKFYHDIYKNARFLTLKNTLIEYSFGYLIYSMHPDSLENIISAELEYQTNKQNPLYDLSSVVIKLSKTMEQEIYIFAKVLFKELITHNAKIKDIEYSVQGGQYTVADIFTNKPNLGTYSFLLKNYLVKSTIQKHIPKVGKYIENALMNNISKLQTIRNETVHAKPPKLSEVVSLREQILGVGVSSSLANLIKARKSIS